MGNDRVLETWLERFDSWCTWYCNWGCYRIDNFSEEWEMNLYSPIIFKNNDKRTDLPDATSEAFDKDKPELDLVAVAKIKEIHDELVQ